MRCEWCLQEFTEEERGQCEFAPPHPSTNPIRAEWGESCPGTGEPLIGDDHPRYQGWLLHYGPKP